MKNTPWYLKPSKNTPWYAKVAQKINEEDKPIKTVSATVGKNFNSFPEIPNWSDISNTSINEKAPIIIPEVPIIGKKPIVNQSTKNAFNNKGMKTEDIKALQQQLVDAGYGKILGKVDGMWGAKSQAALQAFQKDQQNAEARRWEPGSFKTSNLKPNLETKTLMKKGGTIHINPANKGKFTATKKSTGKSTEELTHSKNPLTRKRAIFAQNAKKWKHKEGGKLEILNNIIETFKKGGIINKVNTDNKRNFAQLPKPIKKEEGGKLSKNYIEKAREKAGGSNVGKYPSNWSFAGPSGGAPKGSYPIPDVAHAKSALKLAHNAPNPEGIKQAVYRKFPQLKHAKGGSIKKQEGGFIKKPDTTATADSTKYYSKQMSKNIAEHFNAKTPQDKDFAAKKVTQSKTNLLRQSNKGKDGFDKNGFPIKKQMGGTVNIGEQSKGGGDQAAAYKKGKKISKQMGGQIYGAAKNGTKIDASKWKKGKK